MAKEERVNSFAPLQDNEETTKHVELPSLDEFGVKKEKPLVPESADIDKLVENTGFASRKSTPEKEEIQTKRSMGPRRRTDKTEPLSLKV